MAPAAGVEAGNAGTVDERVAEALRFLERRGTKRNRDGMARYGIVADKKFGVSMATMKSLAKRFGRDHQLALALWNTGWYEARILTAFVDEPERVTSSQMDRWARDFDNWAICDTICMHLFDRTPHAWNKLQQWSGRKDEFVKRAAFALIASLALHDRKAGNDAFLRALDIVESAADDDRNFVKKGVSWALRAIGHRNRELNIAATDTARRLSEAPARSARWIGRDALRDITRPAVVRRAASR